MISLLKTWSFTVLKEVFRWTGSHDLWIILLSEDQIHSSEENRLQTSWKFCSYYSLEMFGLCSSCCLLLINKLLDKENLWLLGKFWPTFLLLSSSRKLSQYESLWWSGLPGKTSRAFGFSRFCWGLLFWRVRPLNCRDDFLLDGNKIWITSSMTVKKLI